MTITIPREPLAARLAAAGRIASPRSTLPILGHVLLLVQSDGARLVASDLETEIDVALPATGDAALALPADKLAKICKAAGGDEIKLAPRDGSCLITCGRSRWTLATLPADDFPRMETADAGADRDIVLPAGQWRSLIGSTLYAQAANDVRYYLNGTHLALRDGRLTLTATDGHRMARRWCDLPHPGAPLERILPGPAIAALQRLLPREEEATVGLRLSEKHLTAVAGDAILRAKFIDGRYPDADRVIPRDLPHLAVLFSSDLRAAVQRVAILSREDFRGVLLRWTRDTLTVSAKNDGNEESTDAIDIDYDGPETAIGYNAQYLIDMIDAVGADRLRVQFADANSSAIAQGEGSDAEVHVIMPMRL